MINANPIIRVGLKKGQYAINQNGPITVQGMKPDTATIGIKNGSGPNMVQINEDTSQ
tara:strand:- start:2425 stop:2595 length:171 start_codon:yes stop_codon:yes gene_type:complete